LPDSPLRRELRVVETVDRETGEVQSRQWSFIGMTTPTVTAFADRLAESQTETRHGGARERFACPDHPDAGALKRTAWSLECADCARVLAVGETVQRVKPDALAEPERETGLQDAIGSASPPPVVAVSLPEQDAIGIGDADFEVADFEVRDRLHDATGMQPLFPPLPSEIAARYAR